MASESDTPQFDDSILDQLRNVYIDLVITTVFNKIGTYNELLRGQFISSEQINEIMHELDHEWKDLLHKSATVTGVLSFLPPDADGTDGVIRKDYYENQDVVFRGVFPVRGEELYATDGSENLYQYNFEVLFNKEGITSDNKSVDMKGTAKVEDIVSLEFEKAMSNERARSILEHYHEDDLEDIEIALLNPSLEECELVMRLIDTQVNCRTPHMSDDAAMARSVRALNVYSNSLFTFDKQIPYHLEMSGSIWLDNGDGTFQALLIENTLASIANVDRLEWSYISGEDEYLVKPHLKVDYHVNKDDPPLKLLIPLSSVRRFWSIRYEHFVGYDQVANS